MASSAREQRQEESEERLRLAIEAAGIGVWDVDNLTGQRRWSAEFKRILGLPSNTEPSLETFAGRIHPEDREWVVDLYRRIYATPEAGGQYDAEFRIVRANDSAVRWVATTGRVTFDALGKAVRGIGTLRDVHEHRQSTEELRRSEERYRALIRASGAMEWRADKDGDLTEAPQWAEHTGAPIERHRNWGWTNFIHPADRDSVVWLWRHAHETGDPVEIDYRAWHAASGQFRWVRERGVALRGPSGAIREWVGTVLDVHDQRESVEALRESEERLRVALAAGRMGTWRYDLTTGQQQWDLRQFELLGVPPGTHPTRDLFLSLVHPDDLDKIEFDPNALPPAGSFLDSEFRITRPDGKVRWITAHSLARYDGSGKAVEMIGVNWDISALKESEAALKLLLNELNHRVKNSLTIVQAIVMQTLRSSATPAEAGRKIEDRIMALSNVHNLLNASRWSGASLSEILRSELRPYGDNRVRLAGGTIGLDVRTALALSLVFHELATNAAKFGSLSKADGRVDVRWTLLGKRRDWLKIVWRELDGPPVSPPGRQGFGSRLVERSIVTELSGRLDADFDPHGLIARVAIPLRYAEPTVLAVGE